MTQLPARRPECKHGHGYMLLRPLERQTPEQRFCGVWYDCPECSGSVLYKSAALIRFLRELSGEQKELPL